MTPLFQNSVKAAKKNKKNSTQLYLKVAEIHDEVAVLKNGGLRAVIKTSSINLNLKSEDEQNAVIYSYQNFLNSLEFPIQIVMRSKKLDLDNYIEKLKKIGLKQTNPLMQKQTFEYIEYVSRLIDYADIMEKEFYVIIPQDPYGQEYKNIFQQFWDNIHPEDSVSKVKNRQKKFEELNKKLTQRVNTVVAGLEGCNLKVKRLGTQELIELFYETYNPLTSRNQKFGSDNPLAIEQDKEVSAAPKSAEAPE